MIHLLLCFSITMLRNKLGTNLTSDQDSCAVSLRQVSGHILQAHEEGRQLTELVVIVDDGLLDEAVVDVGVDLGRVNRFGRVFQEGAEHPVKLAVDSRVS